MKLYGKAPLTELLTSTAAENRLPHAILLTGESGSGRRTIAKYIAKLFMCGAPPSAGCAACNKIDQDSHPDVIYVLDKCGGTYNIKQVREYVCDNTAVKPNDGDVKVYVFEKADTLRPDAQNALLKNIEEPQPWVKFIFICESSASLLTTIRSRVTEYSMPECPEEECAKCLAEQYGVDKKAALDNARMMNGNIGRCLEALNGGDELTDGVCERRRHRNSKSAADICCVPPWANRQGAGSSQRCWSTLRVSSATRYQCSAGGELCSCGKNEAKIIAGVFDDVKLVSMLEKIYDVNSAGQLNINLALSAAYLTSVLL